MPIIDIKLARGRGADELRRLMAGVSRAAADSLAVPESTIRVLVREVDPTLWFSGGQSLQDKSRAEQPRQA